jgi:hypothetical protein
MLLFPFYLFLCCLSRGRGQKSSLPFPSSPLCPFDDLQHYEDSIYSQNGEDGVILKLLSSLGTTNKYYVELGVEDGKQCNTRLLRERYDFHGIMIDGGHRNVDLNLFEEFITIQNILEIFQKYNVPHRFDLLSIDLDLFDWWILAKILGSFQYLPRVIVVEVNPTLGLSSQKFRYQFHEMNKRPLTVTHPITTNQTMWDLTRYSGANPKAFQLLGQQFGYEMVYCESCGVNCFLVQRDLIPSSCLRRDSANSTAHLPLPHISYPCFSTAANNNQRGHPPDMHLERVPLLIDSHLLTLATTDRLSLLAPSVALSYLERNKLDQRGPPELSRPLQSLFFVNQISLSDLITRLQSQLSSQRLLESFLEQVNEMTTAYDQRRGILSTTTTTNPFLYLELCDDLRRHSQTLCEEITASYSQLIIHSLIDFSAQSDQQGTFQTIRKSVEELVSRGLFFTPNDQFLLTLRSYVTLSHRLTHHPSRLHHDGLGDRRYAHSLQSAITAEGIEFYLSLGLSICDSPSSQAAHLTRILEMRESDSPQLLTILVSILKTELFGFAFGDSIISDDWFLAPHHSGDILPSVLDQIPPLLRVLFPPQYSSLTLPAFQSQSLISGSEICSRRASTTVMLIFNSLNTEDDERSLSIRQINHDLISASGCDNQLLSYLLGESHKKVEIASSTSNTTGLNFHDCLQNLLALSRGYLSESMRQVYSSQVHSAFQRIFQLTLLVPSTSESYSSFFFPFTSALWSGPLGTAHSHRQAKILIPLRHPSISLCLLLERSDSLVAAREFFEIYFQSILNSLKYYLRSGDPDTSPSGGRIFMSLVDEKGSHRHINQTHCKAADMEMEVPERILSCYHLLRDYYSHQQSEFMSVSEEMMRSLTHQCYEDL